MRYSALVSNLRVIATLCIVVYHCFCPFNIWEWNSGTTLGTCSLFFFEVMLGDKMLSTFFLLSGYLFYANFDKYRDVVKTFWNKFDRLVIPLIFVKFICPYFHLKSIGTLGVAEVHVWFLYVLFAFFVFGLLTYRINKMALVYFSVVLYLIWIVFDYKGVDLPCNGMAMMKFLLFFVGGYLLNKYMDFIRNDKKFKYFTTLSYVVSVLIGCEYLSLISFNVLLFSTVINVSCQNALWKSLDHCSFGIYIIHHILMFALFPLPFFQTLYLEWPLIATVVMFISLLTVSWSMTWMMKRLGFRYF